MSEPLAALFAQFVRERVYLKAVTRKTETWYWTAWKSFETSGAASGDAVTKGSLQSFVMALRDRGLKPRSVNTYLQCLNAFARWLHEERGSPLARLAPLRTESRVIRTFGDAELRLLLSHKPRTGNERRTHALVSLLVDTGCRIDEVIQLSVGQVDMDNLLLTVKGKGNKERKIPFSVELRKVLFRHLKLDGGHGYVFRSRNGTRLSQRNALRSYYRLKEKVGLPHAGGFHQLRHTFATQYLREGGDLVRLAKQLGHSSVTTTIKYEHLLTEDLRAAHQKLSPLSRLRP